MAPRPESSEADDLLLWSGEEDSKGWNRDSIKFWSRRSYVPQLRPEDLLLPSGLGNLRMLGSCTGMGLVATILYLWFPLMLLEFFVRIGGTLLVGILAGGFLSLTVGLFIWGSIETKRDRELAGRL